MANTDFSSLLYPTDNVREEECYTGQLRQFGVENHRVEAFMYDCEHQLDDPFNEYNGEIQDIESTKDNMIATMMNSRSTKQLLIMIELMYFCLEKRRTQYITRVQDYVQINIELEDIGNAEEIECLTECKMILEDLVNSCPDFKFLEYLIFYRIKKRVQRPFEESSEDLRCLLKLLKNKFYEQSSFAGTTN